MNHDEILIIVVLCGVRPIEAPSQNDPRVDDGDLVMHDTFPVRIIFHFDASCLENCKLAV